MRSQTRQEIETATGHVLEVDGDAILMRCLDDFYVWGVKEDISLTPCIMFDGYWEAWITSWFTRNINEGDFVLDVGANIGYFTMLFERLAGPNGEVWAYECNPDIAELLERTLDYNDVAALVIPLALSDVIGEATLTFPGKYMGSASLGADFDQKYGEHTKIEVETTTLDYEFEYVERTPNLIKIDAEGAEELIWRGGKSLWQREDAPILVIEYTPKAYSKKFPTELFEYGEVTRITHDGGEEPITLEFLENLINWEMLVIRKR